MAKSAKITFKIPCLKSVLSGLKYIHEQMFVHLDLKPSNISSNTLNDTWKISDFGASVNLDKQTGNHSSKSVQTAISCTIPFTATEIFIRDTISTKADIYNFSCVMWCLFQWWNILYSNFMADVIIFSVCSKNTRPRFKCALQKERGLCMKSWNVDPKNRPTAEELVNE